MKNNKIIIVSGRKISENLFREFSLIHHFEVLGYQVKFIFPGRNVNRQGYNEAITKHQLFHKFDCLYFDNNEKLFKFILRYDPSFILFGSYSQYSLLTIKLRFKGFKVLNYNSTSGLDHWWHYSNFVMVKGVFSLKMILKRSRNNLLLPQSSNVFIAGSLAHNTQNIYIDNKQDFFSKYNLDSSKKLIVYFPKGDNLIHKLNTWFKFRGSNFIHDWLSRMLKLNEDICKVINDSSYNFLVKLHPSDYAGYLVSDNLKEKSFTNIIQENQILHPDDTYNMYQYMDLGIGTITHSALDVCYFGKPFIYVDSNKFEQPNYDCMNLSQFSNSIHGPISDCDYSTFHNNWFPSWVGCYSTIKDLPNSINHILSKKISNSCYISFIQEFWNLDCNDAAKKIASLSDLLINNESNIHYC